ncbi:MAG TPA: phospholipase D-like domain-containing protein [Rhizomicrobium sp.]|nr:phospholipase D-like domain-containing protein [Rhizomicrobium sp.]
MFPLTLTWPTESIEAVIGLVYLILAVSVSVDVLLKKSDVRAALGWIAAAWLSPIFGSLLYYMFGINRVTRRALKLRRPDEPQARRRPGGADPVASPNIALLAEVGRRITENPLIAGNAITVLEGGDEAYPEMLAAIAAAKKNIAMASYIYRNDAAGHAFTDALIAAKNRGVEVRVLLDSVGCGYVFTPALTRLKAGGIEVDRFLHTWLPWRMPFLNMRNHRKFLIVDGTLAFTGGMNVDAAHSHRMAGRRAYIEDVHFKVEGPVVRSLMDAFASDWTFTTDEPLDEDHWWPPIAEAGRVQARGLRSGPDEDLYKIEMLAGAALILARKRVRIVTPYFLPDQRLQFAIAEASMRGVEVDIVLPEKSDHVFMQWAMLGHLRFFNYITANIYLSPPPFDHSKLMTVDGEWSLIGSSNWDARSFRLNFEYDLECYQTDLTARLDAIIDQRIAQGHKLSHAELASRPVLIRLRDAAARLLMPYL